MKLLPLLLCLFCLMPDAGATERRLTEFHRFESPPLPFKASIENAVSHGVLRLARVGRIDGLYPYDVVSGKVVRRPDVLDELMFESLMTTRPFESSNRLYPMLARALRVNDDYTRVTIELDPGATFADGAPVTSNEVKRSYDYRSDRELRTIVKRFDVTGRMHVVVEFTRGGQVARDALDRILRMRIFKNNEVGNPEMGGVRVPYTGSGPYDVSQIGPTRLTLVKRGFYWGENHESRRGAFNFSQVIVQYYSDAASAAAALSRGEVDVYVEERPWAVSSLVSSLMKNERARHVRESHALRSESIRRLSFNLERVPDQRVRKALLLLYDFDLINSLYHAGSLNRPKSDLDGLTYAPRETPNEEVAYRLARCAPTLDWKESFENYGHGAYSLLPNRGERHEAAAQLLREAGFTIRNGKMSNGTPLKVSILAPAGNEYQLELFRGDLIRFGIEAEIHNSGDPAQFDLIEENTRLPQSAERIYDALPRNCVPDLIAELEIGNARDPIYRAAMETLARIQQLLYLNIYTGRALDLDHFVAADLLLPQGLSWSSVHIYGRRAIRSLDRAP